MNAPGTRRAKVEAGGKGAVAHVGLLTLPGTDMVASGSESASALLLPNEPARPDRQFGRSGAREIYTATTATSFSRPRKSSGFRV
jgi:hypothetical protein